MLSQGFISNYKIHINQNSNLSSKCIEKGQYIWYGKAFIMVMSQVMHNLMLSLDDPDSLRLVIIHDWAINKTLYHKWRNREKFSFIHFYFHDRQKTTLVFNQLSKCTYPRVESAFPIDQEIIVKLLIWLFMQYYAVLINVERCL